MIQRLFSLVLTAGAAVAQTGLPQVGVLLGGTVSAPLIINNSTHRILAYTLLFEQANGVPHSALHSLYGQLRNKPMSAVGIAPGNSYSDASGTQAFDASGKSRTAGSIAVALDSVMFDDGSLVGPDKAGSFDALSAQLQAEEDAHAILIAANGAASAWTILEGFGSGQTVPAASPGHSKAYQNRYQFLFKQYVDELLRVRARGGDSMALQLAHSSDFYPAIKKGE